MKPHIVADGEMRLRQSPELQAKLRELHEGIYARYAAELSSASFFRRCVLRWRIAMEYRHERRHIVPSAQSLYSSSGGGRWPLQKMARHSKEDPVVKSAREKANKTAIRYVVYWTLGVIGLLAVDMCRRGIVPGNWIPMIIALIVFLVFGVAYLRNTTSKERRRDVIRKLTDPTYE